MNKKDKKQQSNLKTQFENKPILASTASSINENFPIYHESVAEDYDNLQLETYPLNLLFFLKKADDEEIIESMN